MDSELDDRKAAILRAVVEQYIETAQPVGSQNVADRTEVSVSSATVRNEMVALEKDGFLAQPHTSAGRVPTDKGYRFFVDQLVRPGPLGPAERQKVREFFARAHGELEQMLQDTSRLLSGLTSYAAVVVGPPAETATIRSVQVVGLGARVAMVVAVLSNGAVVKHTIELDDSVGEEHLGAVTAHLAPHVVGRSLVDLADVPPSGNAVLDTVTNQATGALRVTAREEPDHVFVGGAARMAAAFDAVETVRSVLDTLEQQYVVVSLLRDVLDRGLSVAIGHEHGLEPLSECAVVVAPYGGEGGSRGSIGVLGPTRMNYPQALAAVAVVSQRLGHRLEEG
ncbi:MAG TPA: heat-inducible transcriptional repressor HrcA [Acidimicrobiales bacterium]|nr:heat-inducible transcriptional repressor HrcA [Acidimicrobiales bacterium]